MSIGVTCLAPRCDRTCGEWHPLDPCPCEIDTCTVRSLKLNRRAHALGCICRECRGSRATKTGHRIQREVQAGVAKAQGLKVVPRNDEEKLAGRLGWHHIEVKSGTSLPRCLSGAPMRRIERQALLAAEGVARGWLVVFELPDGRRRIWGDYDEFLKFLEEGA